LNRNNFWTNLKISYRWVDVCPAVALSTRFPAFIWDVLWCKLWLWWWCPTRLFILLLLVGIKFAEEYIILGIELLELELELNPLFSEVDIFEKANKVSGKLGGVAGVLAGVHIELKWELGWHALDSWKNILKAVSNCQWVDWRSCMAWSRAQPAANTNWLIITCSRSESIVCQPIVESIDNFSQNQLKLRLNWFELN
jgi:hypothetical protein